MSDPTSEWTCEPMNERINKEAGIRSASRATEALSSGAASYSGTQVHSSTFHRICPRTSAIHITVIVTHVPSHRQEGSLSTTHCNGLATQCACSHLHTTMRALDSHVIARLDKLHDGTRMASIGLIWSGTALRLNSNFVSAPHSN